MKRIFATTLMLATASAAFAQATVKDDGKWRSAYGLNLAAASGNSSSTVFGAKGDMVRATKQDKWSLYGNANYGKAAGAKTTDNLLLGTKYNWNLSASAYAFGLGELERDAVASLDSRIRLGVGAGLYLIKSEPTTFEVFGGIGYVADKYKSARTIDGQSRSSYSYPSLILGEESVHKLGASTSAKQRLTLYPNLKNSGAFTATWDASVSVAINAAASLSSGVTLKHNSEPGAGVKKNDMLFTTGINWKFD